ncbi:hypothetical protein A3K34_03060 [candidate division WWE3 bacterium RIFOXYC1_FULL_40_10]|uniref:Uncharacterized protein n=1 Tax=candidate division WWE3 bacterium RIFOXYA2_FULL_46_9 TaxID=1802636 RepID=A0A1F4W0A3_UNCKA|nr:MAG: hypothetical protein A3K58_03060 [candidate division WWE3 bacterium RIFOXYB1_FULL_40_22]OGC61827.1 MAG: hypothetical protein A3K37_03060 [candidate division WWE3 bacterium RIFOXYA1_FULL_40_11]OGC62844.1 MAG: hypothetical protein A2264_04220 [candidate division WWE3 bacterium RIFOXYA2_FULL_46_9]OGC64299.1 MAG: hypothetical protein A2326_00475 [candidate division WWE3 bacterium RIFOXYB2_FULL_41_6]OGC66210.1 MAG: hypothetical protein A3K34_03060 [candidate division WWE3 bacterium RIFOXYC1_
MDRVISLEDLENEVSKAFLSWAKQCPLQIIQIKFAHPEMVAVKKEGNRYTAFFHIHFHANVMGKESDIFDVQIAVETNGVVTNTLIFLAEGPISGTAYLLNSSNAYGKRFKIVENSIEFTDI